ncbi:MAG: hypothetical protein ACP5LE_07855 [Thermoplasmata archaeon]
MTLTDEIKQLVKNYVGPLGEIFLRKQCDIIHADIENLTIEDLKKLIPLIEKNSVLLCGKGKSMELKNGLEAILTKYSGGEKI